MGKSIWEFDIKTNTTRKNIDCDILIIGGGMTGVSTAYMLSNTNKKIVLIDSDKIGHGITCNTTGKISVMQGYNYQNISKISSTVSNEYLESQIFSVNLLIDIIEKNNIKCDLVKNNSYLFTNSSDKIDKINLEKDILDPYLNCEVIDKLPNGFPCLYGIKTDYSYVFNPLKYINSIIDICKNKVDFFENMRAIKMFKKLDHYLIKTNKNKICAKKVIICTHYPIFVKKLFFPIFTSITKEYIVAAKVDKTYNSNMICNDNSVISMRYYDDYIIYAGYDSLLGNNLDNKKNMNNVINDFKKHFNYPIKYSWYNYDIRSTDYLPIIDEVDDNVFVATAYNKWGMSNSILAASIISDKILNKNNKFSSLVSINRKSLRNMACFKNIYDNVVTYFKPKKSNIEYQYIDGVKYAIYTDKDKVQHKVLIKCPHLGCNLIFNDIDKTWDCPCHGSRYDIDGNVIHGPSSLSIKKK